MAGKFRSMSPSTTVRIKCDPTTYIYAGLEDVVRAAIPLGKNQVDLAVVPDGIDRVNRCFTSLSALRLLSSDPLFAIEGNVSYAKTAFRALKDMHRRYCDERDATLLCGDEPLADWYAKEIDRFNQLIIHYQKQINREI
ncbi:uncharacterized protein N7496_000851 [Penicillium cataractarum]|uniref:Uncharacterized protein n=1 Tax=Penicillium cataractarum TaxID=2100454 RepID=A0A9W9VUZ0_9EURO|nr:uncharacterized protein N7496_000851 [Penicillium cataractarum]KAJ5389783.1 hypothetical protein N7496_000851 [Penicillium cataractarum]